MNYVRCIYNQAYIEWHDQEFDPGETTTLTLGKVYKVAPRQPNDGEMIRIYDDTAEDYLFPAAYFEPYLPDDDLENRAVVTVHLSAYQRNVLHAEALATRRSVSALVRDWIDERLDLPVEAEN
jgi:hypothetical protein